MLCNKSCPGRKKKEILKIISRTWVDRRTSTTPTWTLVFEWDFFKSNSNHTICFWEHFHVCESSTWWFFSHLFGFNVEAVCAVCFEANCNSWSSRRDTWQCERLLTVLLLWLVYCCRTSSRQPRRCSQLMKQLPIMPLTFDYLFWNQYCPLLELAAGVSGRIYYFYNLPYSSRCIGVITASLPDRSEKGARSLIVLLFHHDTASVLMLESAQLLLPHGWTEEKWGASLTTESGD